MSSKVCAVSAIVALIMATTRVASAAEVPPKEADATVPQLKEVVVTGSNIPTTSTAADMPVTVVGQRQIQETGTNSNVLDILRKSIPSVIGRDTAGNSNANNNNVYTAGGSKIQILNLDTLVLVIENCLSE